MLETITLLHRKKKHTSMKTSSPKTCSKPRRRISKMKNIGINVDALVRNSEKACKKYGLGGSCYKPKKRDTKIYQKEWLYVSRYQ